MDDSQSSVVDLRRFVLQNPVELFENASDGYVIVDSVGRFVLVNKSFEKVTGYSREEVIGKRFTDIKLLSMASRLKATQQFLARMRGEKIVPYEIEAFSKWGDQLIYEINATPIVKDERIVGDFVVLRDLTHRKRMEATLEKQMEKLRELIKLVSHDLKLEVAGLKQTVSELKKPSLSFGDQIRKAERVIREIDSIIETMEEKIEE